MSRKLILVFAATAVLAGCGGGSDSDDIAAAPPAPPVTAPAPSPAPAPPPPSGVVPSSASSSIEAFIGYLLTLTGMADQSSEPLDVSSVSPPTTETAEPSTLP